MASTMNPPPLTGALTLNGETTNLPPLTGALTLNGVGIVDCHSLSFGRVGTSAFSPPRSVACPPYGTISSNAALLSPPAPAQRFARLPDWGMVPFDLSFDYPQHLVTLVKAARPR